jgi:hypothetical protein
MTHGNEQCYDQRGETAMKLGQADLEPERGFVGQKRDMPMNRLKGATPFPHSAGHGITTWEGARC